MPVVKPKPTWRTKLIALAWVVAIAAALLYLVGPGGEKPMPTGWTQWPGPGATRALLIADDGIVAGGPNGLFQIRADGTAPAVAIPGTSGSVGVTALLAPAAGTLWVGHDQGLSIRTARDGWQTLGVADGLPHANVAALAATGDGRVWVGTTRGAACLPVDGPWNRRTARRITTKEGLLHDTVSAVLVDRDGAVWFGNYAAPEGGVSRFADGRWQHWTPADGLPHPNVTSLIQTGDGRVWAGCGLFKQGGCAVFGRDGDGWRLEHTIPTAELAGPKVRSLYEDRAGRVWLGSEYDGLTIRHAGKTLRTLTPEDGLPAWEVMTIRQAGDGAVWLGTLSGVVRIAPEAVAALLAPPATP